MSVFSPLSMDYPQLGRLIYRSFYWLGKITLPPFNDTFTLIFRAGRGGPSERQLETMYRIIADADIIKQQATRHMADMHRLCRLFPPTCSEDESLIWQELHADTIEVTDEGYCSSGDAVVLLIFSSTQHDDFGPAIETRNGRYSEVLGGS